MRLTPLSLVIVALFVATLITANIMAVKLFRVAGQVLPAAVIIFPLSYIIGDVLTEVYGYRLARRVIWLGFLCNAVVVVAFWLGSLLPPAPDWKGQGAYEQILGATPRILMASFIAYLVGEFSNAIVLARMKVTTRGRWLWIRTIGSTIVGEGLDSAIFITGAYVGTVPGGVLGHIVLALWVTKVLYEVAATPLTYAVVGYLKRKEQVDVYDVDTSFNPLAMFR